MSLTSSFNTVPMNLAPNVLTVTQLNRQIKNWLELDVGIITVEGEVSTLSRPASGHYYFTLKDATAQIRCVYFRNRHTSRTEQTLQAGQHVVLSGLLSLYEARGDYQLIVEHIEAAGIGDLYRQFEQLKVALAAQGLFDASRKKLLPIFPRCIGVITSPTAAALQDILTTLARRYPLAPVVIYPSDVQGNMAANQLIAAIERANHHRRCDVLILARGGGSMEDLWAFNHEQLAQAIANSNIPIVSGVGHETDLTIADFVADYRAATPTAAAESVTPNQVDLLALINSWQGRIEHAMRQGIARHQQKLRQEIRSILSPERLVRSLWQNLDHTKQQLLQSVRQSLRQKQHQLQLLNTTLQTVHPLNRIQQTLQQLYQLRCRLVQLIHLLIQQAQARFVALIATLHAVSPLATLDRGYAIATYKNSVITHCEQVGCGDFINLRLAHGQLTCKVIDHA